MVTTSTEYLGRLGSLMENQSGTRTRGVWLARHVREIEDARRCLVSPNFTHMSSVRLGPDWWIWCSTCPGSRIAHSARPITRWLWPAPLPRRHPSCGHVLQALSQLPTVGTTHTLPSVYLQDTQSPSPRPLSYHNLAIALSVLRLMLQTLSWLWKHF